MKKYIIKRDKRGLPEKFTHYRKEINKNNLNVFRKSQ